MDVLSVGAAGFEYEMSRVERDLNDCESYVAKRDTGVPKGGLGNTQYRRVRRTVIAAALQAAKERTPRHRFRKRTLRILRREYGVHSIQLIIMVLSIARFIQMVWDWWEDKKDAEAI